MVFRDGPDRVKQILPFSAFDSQDPEKLWTFMADYEKLHTEREESARALTYSAVKLFVISILVLGIAVMALVSAGRPLATGG